MGSTDDRAPSESEKANLRVEASEVLGVGGDDLLASSTCADHDMGIRYVGRPGHRQQPSDARRVDPVEWDDLRRRLADQPSQTYLAVRSANGLGERRGRDTDGSARLRGAGEQHHDTSIVPVERY